MSTVTITRFSFSVSEGCSEYFEEFVAGINEHQFEAQFISDPTGDQTPQVTVQTNYPHASAFWSVLLEDVVNGSDELLVDVVLQIVKQEQELGEATFDGAAFDAPNVMVISEEVIYETSLENLAIVLVNPINSNSGTLQFALFEIEDEEAEVFGEDNPCGDEECTECVCGD